MKIIETTNLIEQFRFPRTKKRRIRNKWAKRNENYRPARHGYMMAGALYCHPKFTAALREQIRPDPVVSSAIDESLFDLL